MAQRRRTTRRRIILSFSMREFLGMMPRMQKMQKETIGIVGGTGEFGSAFAEHFERKGHGVLISGRTTPLSHEELAKKSDIVILSVPISAIEEVCQIVAPHLKKESLLMDFCSTKEAPLKSMLQAFSGEVLGCHPLFGPRNILPNQPVVFCHGRGEAWLPKIREIFQEFRILEMDEKKHDQCMGIIQGLQHFLENAFAETIAKSGVSVAELLDISSPVYHLQMNIVGRILGQNELLYGEIVYGSEASRKTIADFLKNAQHLFEGNQSEFEEHFRKNRKFFGDFCKKAQEESDRIIALLSSEEHVSKDTNEESTKGKIGLLGPKYTWSDLAGQMFFAQEPRALFPNFSSVLSALKKDEIDFAFLPLENSISGSVRQVWNGVAENDFWIERVFEFPIHHILAAPLSTKKVEKIFGHPEAIAQCGTFLHQQYPNADIVTVASTAESVIHAEKTKNSAALCSRLAAESAYFSLLAKNIADISGNTTRFGLIRKRCLEDVIEKNEGITSVFFELKNKPSALLSALKVFSDAGKNLLRIESRPVGNNFSEYAFFVDFEGGISEDWKKGFREKTENGKILGQYSVEGTLEK